jgi:hypothetical protein
VRRASDNATLDVKVKAAGGFADAAAQVKSRPLVHPFFRTTFDCH